MRIGHTLRHPRHRLGARPRLEALEDRSLPTLVTFTWVGGEDFLRTPTGSSDRVSVRFLTPNVLEVSLVGQSPVQRPVNTMSSVAIDREGGTVALTVDDSGDNAPHNAISLSADSLTGLFPAAISWGGVGGVQSLTVLGGVGGNTFYVMGTPAPTTLLTGGQDAVVLGDDQFGLQDIVGPLSLVSQPGFTVTVTVNEGAVSSPTATITPAGLTGLSPAPIDWSQARLRAVMLDGSSLNLIVDDSADPVGREVTLAALSLTGLPPAPIMWAPDSLQSLKVLGGMGVNTFNVTDLPLQFGQPIPVFLDGGGASNQNTLNVLAGTHRDWTIIGTNAGTVAVTLGPIPGPRPPGPGLPPPIMFNDMANLAGGDPGDDYVKFNNGSMITGTLKAGSGGGTLDYTAYSTGVIVILPLGRATAVYGERSNGITGFTTIMGGSGGESDHVYNILVGDGGDLLIGGTGRRNLLIAGAGAPSILYGGNSDDILIAGSTDYDADLDALKAIMTEWARTDESASKRMANVQAGTGDTDGNALTTTTVHTNGGGDWVICHAAEANPTSPTGTDLIFAQDSTTIGPDYVYYLASSPDVFVAL